jgi:hypothetical protein
VLKTLDPEALDEQGNLTMTYAAMANTAVVKNTRLLKRKLRNIPWQRKQRSRFTTWFAPYW